MERSMFDHISFGITNLERSLAFYDAALKPLSVNRMFALPDQGIAGYTGPNGVTFWLYAKTVDQVPLQTIPDRPRFHLAFQAPNRAAVDAFYQAAIANGGSDSGPPGLRTQYHPHYYAAYVFDQDGYKLEAVCHQPE
jgi:catechol 2,3-dioxygenase-like lactoylglutathione lyase family enzyme